MRKRGPNTATLEAIAHVNAAMKGDVVTVASDDRFRVEKVPTGSLVLDRITGGGWARGRHIELYGDENVGKSLITYLTMALAQQRGELCALIDSEHTFEASWFRALGGDPGALIIFRPENAEEVIKVLMAMANPGPELEGLAVVGIDSVASLAPLEELAKDPIEGDDRIGNQARMMSKLLRRVTTVNDKTIFLFTNQWREKIGTYVPTKARPGGLALGFYATTRIEMRKGEKITEERNIVRKGKEETAKVKVGHWVICTSEKEKTARPYQQGMFAFDAEEGGIDTAWELINLGMEDGLIVHSGNYYSYTTESGREFKGQIKKFRQSLRDDEELREELSSLISDNTRILAGIDG